MLAIVIPYYKHAFFESTLISLKNQTNKQFNVYVGDDASPDSPKPLLDKYKNDFPLFYKRFNSNLGGISLVEQWGRCLDMVLDEEWVLILGDDDMLSNNFVEAFYKYLDEINQLKINVIRYASVVINEHDEKISKRHTHPKIESSTDFLIRKLQGGTRSSLSEFVFKRKILETKRFKDLPLAWCSDYLAVLECSNFGNMYTINEAFMLFRLSGLNITSKKDDLTPKNVATFNFYYYLLDKKHTFFNKGQIEALYYMLEKTFLDNKKSIKFWVLFTKLYLSYFQINRYFNFFRKALRLVLKNKHD